MSLKSLMLVVAFVGGSIIVWMLFFLPHSGARTDDSISDRAKLVEVLEGTPTRRQFHKPVDECDGQDPLLVPGAVYQRPDESIAAERLSQAFSDPLTAIAKAKTDPAASIALFELAASCFPEQLRAGVRTGRPRPGCPLSALKLPVKIHPIELLVNAAEQGSVEAKMMFALNAPIVAAKYRQIGTSEDMFFAQDILLKAEKYGADAARAGNREANRYMSRAYETGAFRAPDIETAYAFALPLQIDGVEQDKRMIASLKARLTDRIRLTAERKAFGCTGSPGTGAGINPFG